MCRWHAEFEKRAPEAHHQFLLGLGITEAHGKPISQVNTRNIREK
jgi:hypothetical protein